MARKRVVNPDGSPTWATDERGVPLYPSNEDLWAMHNYRVGTGAEYLQQRKQQLEELAEKEREEVEKELYIKRFLESGGTSRTAAEEAYRQHKNETAAEAARAADAEAAAFTRAQIRNAL